MSSTNRRPRQQSRLPKFKNLHTSTQPEPQPPAQPKVHPHAPTLCPPAPQTPIHSNVPASNRHDLLRPKPVCIHNPQPITPSRRDPRDRDRVNIPVSVRDRNHIHNYPQNRFDIFAHAPDRFIIPGKAKGRDKFPASQPTPNKTTPTPTAPSPHARGCPSTGNPAPHGGRSAAHGQTPADAAASPAGRKHPPDSPPHGNPGRP